jgi:hypothetical protein
MEDKIKQQERLLKQYEADIQKLTPKTTEVDDTINETFDKVVDFNTTI